MHPVASAVGRDHPYPVEALKLVNSVACGGTAGRIYHNRR
jgi:hypothetical protein